MMVVSRELFEQLCHPERKPKHPLDPKDLVARDSFTGETMSLASADDFFQEGKDADDHRLPDAEAHP